MVISCDDCVMQHTDACAECVVTHVLGADEHGVVLDVRSEQIVRLLVGPAWCRRCATAEWCDVAGAVSSRVRIRASAGVPARRRSA